MKADLYAITDHLDVLPLVIVKKHRIGNRVKYETEIHKDYPADEQDRYQHRIYYQFIWAKSARESKMIFKSIKLALESRLKGLRQQMFLLDNQVQRLRLEIDQTEAIMKGLK